MPPGPPPTHHHHTGCVCDAKDGARDDTIDVAVDSERLT